MTGALLSPVLVPPLSPVLVAPQGHPAQSTGGGVPMYLVINGVLSILLLDSDSTPLQDNDNTYLYEAV